MRQLTNKALEYSPGRLSCGKAEKDTISISVALNNVGVLLYEDLGDYENALLPPTRYEFPSAWKA